MLGRNVLSGERKDRRRERDRRNPASPHGAAALSRTAIEAM